MPMHEQNPLHRHPFQLFSVLLFFSLNCLEADFAARIRIILQYPEIYKYVAIAARICITKTQSACESSHYSSYPSSFILVLITPRIMYSSHDIRQAENGYNVGYGGMSALSS